MLGLAVEGGVNVDDVEQWIVPHSYEKVMRESRHSIFRKVPFTKDSSRYDTCIIVMATLTEVFAKVVAEPEASNVTFLRLHSTPSASVVLFCHQQLATIQK